MSHCCRCYKGDCSACVCATNGTKCISCRSSNCRNSISRDSTSFPKTIQATCTAEEPKNDKTVIVGNCCRCYKGDCNACVCATNGTKCISCRSSNCRNSTSRDSTSFPKTIQATCTAVEPKNDTTVIVSHCCRCYKGDCSACVCATNGTKCISCRSSNCRNASPQTMIVKKEKLETTKEFQETVKILATPKDGPTGSSKSGFGIVSWNIQGPGHAARREAVVSATLKGMNLDILCLQENTVKYGGRGGATIASENFRRRIPINENGHGCAQVTEDTGSLHNQVLYDRSMFCETECFNSSLEQAYELMKDEKKIIDWIEMGGDDRKQKFTQDKIPTSEVVNGCRVSIANEEQIKKLIDDLHMQIAQYGYNVCRNHFVRRDEAVTKDAKQLLVGRAAMVFLKGQDTTLLVISFHSYHPTKNPEGLNYLLFNLVEKLFWCTAPIPVLICGDFNEDITRSNDPMVREFIKNYMVPEYYPRPLRGGLGRIDYIILRNTGLSTCKLKVEAIDMMIPEELGNQSAIEYCKMVSNHSPLVANLEI